MQAVGAWAESRGLAFWGCLLPPCLSVCPEASSSRVRDLGQAAGGPQGGVAWGRLLGCCREGWPRAGCWGAAGRGCLGQAAGVSQGEVAQGQALGCHREGSQAQASWPYQPLLLSAVNFDHFQILRAIGKGSFGKVRPLLQGAWGARQLRWAVG